MDRAKMERGIREFLEGIGERFPGDDAEKTPQRVARAWVDDLVSGYALDPAAQLSWSEVPEGAGPVFVRSIGFSSVCVHHLLPFFGRAHVAYLPRRRLAGLSKIGRVVDAHARRLQTQEHLTAGIVSTLTETLQPQAVLALLEAHHTCMSLRGVRKERSRMVTVAASGLYQTDVAARSEALALLGSRAGDLTE
jgi:GTP cyclohydrolase I